MTLGNTTSTGDRLAFTFFAAIALHLFILLQLGFKIPGSDKIAPTLNITLATSVAQQAPEEADFLAQQNQEASGTGEEVKELLTDTDADFNDTVIRDIMPPPQQKTTEAAEVQTETLNTESRSRFQFEDDEQTEQTPEEENVQAQDEDIPLTNPDRTALRAKLDRLRQAEAKRPNIRRIQREATRASDSAAYLHAFNAQVQRVGNENFPQELLDKRQFGQLTMAVVINPDGSIYEVEILDRSEHDIINQSALQMVYSAAPFDRIPVEVLDGHDKLEIVRIWTFEITGLSVNSNRPN